MAADFEYGVELRRRVEQYLSWGDEAPKFCLVYQTGGSGQTNFQFFGPYSVGEFDFAHEGEVWWRDSEDKNVGDDREVDVLFEAEQIAGFFEIPPDSHMDWSTPGDFG